MPQSDVCRTVATSCIMPSCHYINRLADCLFEPSPGPTIDSKTIKNMIYEGRNLFFDILPLTLIPLGVHLAVVWGSSGSFGLFLVFFSGVSPVILAAAQNDRWFLGSVVVWWWFRGRSGVV